MKKVETDEGNKHYAKQQNVWRRKKIGMALPCA